MRVLSFLAHHATTILIALFVLVVTTATAACRRGPVLDMRGGGDAGAISVSSAAAAAIAEGSVLANVGSVHPRLVAGGWTENAGAIPAVAPSAVAAPHLLSGACARGFVGAPSVGPLCYRSCVSDADCSDETTCSAGRRGRRRGDAGVRVCVAR